MKKTVIAVASFTLLAASTQMATAITAFDVGTTGGPYFDAANIGMAFIPNQDIIVTKLGAYDYLGDGFSGTPEVGVFDESHTLLSSVVLPSGDSASIDGDGFRYASVPELTLFAGQKYWISSTGWLVDELLVGTGGGTTAPEITSYSESGPGGWYLYGGADLYFPSSEYIYDQYLGPNFQFRLPDDNSNPQGVPDGGATLALAGISMGGIFLLRRRCV